MRDKHDGQRLGKVEDEDEGIEGHEAADGRPAVANATGDGTSDQDANEGADRAAHLESALPVVADDGFALVVEDGTVVLREGRERDEVAHEEDTVCLHNDGARHDEGPGGSHGIRLDGLDDAHVDFGTLSLHGAGLVVARLGVDVDVDMADLLLDLGHGARRLGLDVVAHDGQRSVFKHS